MKIALPMRLVREGWCSKRKTSAARQIRFHQPHFAIYQCGEAQPISGP
jgi:hypothetical protein